MTKNQPRDRIVPELQGSVSVMLDVMRFAAAVTVLLSHVAQPRYSVGFPNLVAVGHLAVAVFFVLSGFVIRYVTLTKETTAGEYLIDRASRIYSVVAPALVLTVLCELAAKGIRPEYYEMLRQPFLWRDVPIQVAANLTFQAQNWGYAIDPLSNLPFWSLSFECLYYAIYGLIFYRVRRGVAWCCLLFLLAGPSIALLFPVWLMGSLSYDLYRRWGRSRVGFSAVSAISAAVPLALLAAHRKFREVLVMTDEAHRTSWLSGRMLHAPFHTVLFSQGTVPWLSQASVAFVVVGLATAVFTTWAALALDRARVNLPRGIVRSIRIVADSTFALYLAHLPLLILVVTALGKPLDPWTAAALIVIIILICIGLGQLFDKLKKGMRRWMWQIDFAWHSSGRSSR